ncbi:stress-induced protein [Kaistia algarum]|uniref:stress-induced protein n=1 Tax=Kaistia algarum TaxID=2083279 RepID=UPI000CE79FD7|nr:stress-induced protein [Kaistia algarum]MCX5516402.1 stress-induced protein [Kaistia algarum]PPE78686.1 stress-induced protein [Kaistia algarum]
MANQNEQRGGSGNATNDPKRPSDMGKKSGDHSGGRQQEQHAGDDKRQQGSHAKDSHTKDTGSKTGQR